MKHFLCKIWAYIKYYFIKFNLKYDGMKEPWRLLVALTLIAPCWWGLSAKNYDWRYVSILWIIVLMASRMIYEKWIRNRIFNGGDK